MLTSKPQDIFEFNMQYKNSIAFTEMKEIMTHLLYTITFNLDIFTKFIEKQRIKADICTGGSYGKRGNLRLGHARRPSR